MPHDELPPDPLVRAALGALRPVPRYSAAELDRLALHIMARLPESRSTWREEVVRLGRVLAPLALAAGLAAFLLFRGWGGEPTAESSDAFLSALTGQATSETVLDAALGQQDGAWMLAERR